MADVLFCLDSESIRHPGLVGLGDERLESLAWLHLSCTAREARDLAKSDARFKEVWVSGSDDMDGINLAAAIKRDASSSAAGPHAIMLVGAPPSGSSMSRARMAGIETVLDGQAFARHYAKAKRTYAAAAANPTSASSHALSLAVISACGGAGKSTLAALAASMAAERGLSTLLIDADLQFGSAASRLKKAREIDSAELLTGLSALESPQGEDALAVTTPPARLEQAESLACELPALIDAASALYDIVIVDTGPTWDDTQLSIIERCTKTLFVVDQRASSIRAAKRAFDLLVRCGIAVGPIQFALNRCAKTAAYSSLDLSCALQGATVFELKDGGREVEELLSVGMAEALIEERNPLAESLAALLGTWLPSERPESSPTPKQTLGNSLFGKRKRR